MKKSDVGVGLGMAAIMAVCCGGHLLLLAVAAPALAFLTGQTVLIAASIVLAISAVAAFVWRQRSARCAPGTCAPSVMRSAVRSAAEDSHPSGTVTQRELVTSGREDHR